MTAIAYRDGIMACDTRTDLDFLTVADPKIIKHQGWLLGVSGDECPHNDDIAQWFFIDTKTRKKLPFKDVKFTLLGVNPQGKLQLWGSDGLCYPLPRAAKFWAVGSGAELCMGAMAAGATAAQAVAIAIKWSPSVGGKVVTRKLKGK